MLEVPFNNIFRQIEDDFSEYMRDIEQCIRDSTFIGGKPVENFERSFASAIGAEYAVSCGNGTDSLLIAMKALDLKPGDEVIVPAMSWISTSETVTAAGGVVIFCDIDPDSYAIDTSKLESLVSVNTVGIIPVHLYGHPADLDEINKIAKKHDLWVIEDCAQAHLALYKDKPVGTFGEFGSFSFFPGKNLGAFGDAGAVVTDDIVLRDKFTRFARHGGLFKGEHLIEGHNSRLDTLQAVVLNRKLLSLTAVTEKRRHIAAIYANELKNIEGLILPTESPNVKHAWHLFVVRVTNRVDFSNFLKSNRIATGIHYPVSLPFLPAYKYKGHAGEDFPVANERQSEIVSLPLFPAMLDEQIDHVLNCVKTYFIK
ncbi:DegT/DnrJ/EryC1/StrS family aminotransferase [Alphaproteobacteria bacterium]|nr:DegT/DnrJ/EryC1/StrS family aminotransferase [Alphaproteobacteria bacterium]